ncbi:MAG TPA: SDR family oxidoreductase [Bacteroidetes bacterium]|nr:SDR family oxidoreductase [Bacteroidota bacterium]
MNMDLKNKNILITGGAKRVGAAISRYLSARGAHMIIHFNRSVQEAKNLHAELTGLNRPVDFVQADLENLSGLHDMVDTVLQKHGRIDGLICNASIFFHTPFFSVTEEEWDQIVAVNLKSYFFLCQMIGKKMVEQKSGKIVIITDVSADHPWCGYLPYTITKAGLAHLVKGLAKTLSPSVQVNGVAPGTVLPPEDASARQVEKYENQTLLKRVGTPDDIAKTVHFLIADSEFITGVNIPVDGGYRLRGNG